MFASNLSRARLRSGFALLLVLAIWGAGARPASAAPIYSVNGFEAEATKLPAGAVTFADAAASGGAALVFKLDGTARRSVLTPAADRLLVRARGDSCNGAPRLTVAIDGVSKMNVLVPATVWTNYVVPVTVTPGYHGVAVSYDNDYVDKGVCNRNLRIDSVVFQSSIAINTGTPGSLCQASDGGFLWSMPPVDTSMNALGAAPAYYEAAPPSGAFAGLPPKGVMMLIHGGGWHKVGPGIVALDRGRAAMWRERGWTTVSVTYSGCGRSLDDVLWFYDHIRATWPAAAVCAGGYSAGGHLALMLAALRPDLACALSQGGPTDFPALPSQVAYDKATGGTSSSGPTKVYHLAIAAFGQDRLTAISPLTYAPGIRSKLLLATAATDTLVPLAQADSLAAAVRAASPELYVDVRVLEVGDVQWVHGTVLGSSIDLLHAAEDTLLGTLPLL